MPAAVSEGMDYAPVQRAPFSVGFRLRSAAWGIVRGTLFRWSPRICRGFRRALLRIFGAEVSPRSSIDSTARIDFPWNLSIGEMSSIGESAWIYALDRVVIKDRTCVGQRASLIAGSHDYRSKEFQLVTKPITIGSGCWICALAVVLPGVVIGDFSVIGAASVVARSVGDNSVAAGNPCRIIGPRWKSGEETG